MAAKKSGREIPVDADLHLHWRFFFDPPEFMTTFAIVGADATDYEELEGKVRNLNDCTIQDHCALRGCAFSLLSLGFPSKILI